MKNDDDIYIRMAHVLSEKSKCVSFQVGCLIVKDRRIVSNGYNGTPAGFKNCCDVFSKSGFDRERHHDFSQRFEIHAEMNAILFAARQGISIEGATLYSTHQPCSECLKNIVQSGIVRVIYLNSYDKSGWDNKTTEFINESCVIVKQHAFDVNK